MICFIGLGSNLGDRRQNLEKAAQALQTFSGEGGFRVSPLYETPALMPPGAPFEWNRPYLNAVIQIDWTGSPHELLGHLKKIEKDLGRTPSPRWAPRVLDLDLLTFGQEMLRSENLKVPHEGLFQRSFVLDPFKDLAPGFMVPGSHEPVVVRARRLATHKPLVMGIVNLTPDSFSDGGENVELSVLENKFKKMRESGVAVIDLGAESTRPGAQPLTFNEEWRRLEPALKILQTHLKGTLFRPRISIDTRHAWVVERALEYGVDWINDVSGGADPRMFEILQKSSCEYVLMHSLTVPANPRVCLSPEVDPVGEVKKWLEVQSNTLAERGIEKDRIIFDPGIGFGKTAAQSVALLDRIEEFAQDPVRILVGHSRKSFLNKDPSECPRSRDAVTLKWSLELARQGVDVLRVHDFESHQRSFYQ